MTRIASVALIAAACLTASSLLAGEARAQQSAAALGIEAPDDVLLVGNSYLYYNDSLHNHLRRMVAEGMEVPLSDLKYVSITISGGSIGFHPLDHYLTPQNVGAERPFDVVIMQGHSAAALSEGRVAAFDAAVDAGARAIKAAGAVPALYMTHAYDEGHKRYDAQNMAKIRALYSEAGERVGGLVIPVGLAFEEARRRSPDLELQQDYDHSHPTLLGTYLAAATAYAALYGKSPVGLSYDYYGRIDPETAAFLRQVAQDTVSAFYGG